MCNINDTKARIELSMCTTSQVKTCRTFPYNSLLVGLTSYRPGASLHYVWRGNDIIIVGL